ncbi:ribonuclease D [Naumannella sp. ID2617S]|nr:ribonuclease D [Naumannella sp. ID2617S]
MPTLAAPAEPLPPVVTDATALDATITALAGGSGPVAVDAERAQGYRYTGRAYLIQLRRTGAGTHLIDPVTLAEAGTPVTGLLSAIADAEWIIHAATQDTPCLAELGLVPQRLFDTELAGRLLGFPRVALGALVEHYFGLRLLKEHSAADWSTRPLPADWLNYAALDVELLVELRDRQVADLEAAGKLGWAEQEFAWLAGRASAPAVPRVDPWRRTSGIHAVRSPAGLAVVRELWQARDDLARRLDRAPGRILPDKAIAELAAKTAPGRRELQQVPGFQRRSAKRYETNWVTAVDRARSLSKSELPLVHLPSEGPPPPRTWESRDPEAYARHQRMRAVMTDLAERHDVPAENLCTPEFWRRLAWHPPEPADETAVDAFLAELGARRWQRELVVGPLTEAVQEPASPPRS